MKQHTRVLFLCCSALGAFTSIDAQFYPDSVAAWCLYNSQSVEPTYYSLQMPPLSDTLIGGLGYRLITGLDGSGLGSPPLYYVRNGSDGKGYRYVPDSSAEYLTGDVSAEAGDTVQNVLMMNGSWGCGQVQELVLSSVVVDSVRALSNAGVTVVRHYIHPLCWTEFQWYPSYQCFWQRGAGTSHGPLLILSSDLSYVWPECITVADSTVYGVEGFGLPGGPFCCHVFFEGLEDLAVSPTSQVSPNPSTGLFHFTGTTLTEIHILDTQGRTLFTTNKPEVDLSAYPVGCYRAVVVSESGKSSLPLVVVR
jgi:hypothetical protein